MLPEFEQYKTCPACTASRFALVNAENKCKFFYKFHKHPVMDGRCMTIKEIKDDSPEISINHLHVTCNRCNYEWIEQTAFTKDVEYGE